MDINRLAQNAETYCLMLKQGTDISSIRFEIKEWMAECVLYFEKFFPKSNLLIELLKSTKDFSNITQEKVENIAAIISAAEKVVQDNASNAQWVSDLNKNEF